jgi:hypothetical protein
MALTLTELQAITDNYIESTDNDIYFKSNIMLYKLMGGEQGRKTIPGGKKIQVVLEYAAANAGSYGNTTKLPLDKKEVFNAAFFPWAAYYAGITIDLEDQRQNNGDLAIVNLVNGKIKNAQKSIRKTMGEDIYKTRAATENAAGFSGLGDLFSTDTAVAYGEIAEDDMSDWAGVTYASAVTMGFAGMQTIRRQASIDDNMEGKPNLYITTETLKDKFENSLQSNSRYTNAKLVEAGFDNILFGGAPVVTDNKCAAGYVYGMNLHFLDIYTHKDYNFTPPVWSSPIDQPDVKVAFIRWGGNLVCRNRKAHVLATSVS